jgi:hypothetical protein
MHATCPAYLIRLDLPNDIGMSTNFMYILNFMSVMALETIILFSLRIFQPTFLPKGKCGLMKSQSCLYLFPSHQILNQLVDFYEIQERGHAIEGDPDSIVFNTLVSTIPKWRTIKLLRWLQNLHKST